MNNNTTPSTEDWQKDFDERFGCRNHSLLEAKEWSESGRVLLYPGQGNVIKSFITSLLAQAKEEGRNGAIRKVEEMLTASGWTFAASKNEMNMSDILEAARHGTSNG